jgi:putative membrane protein
MAISGQLFGSTGIYFASNILNNLDDIDRAVAKLAKQQAAHMDLEHMILVDAHHGVEDICDPLLPFTYESEDLLAAVTNGIRIGQQETQNPFEFGVAHEYPTPYSVTEGFGPAGVSCLVIKTSNETICYLSIDANNLVVGLREQIVKALKENHSFTHVEIITTDTHMVSGLDTRGMGFNPLGEKIEHQLIVSLCDELARNAKANIYPGSVSYRELQVDDACVLGRENMDAFTTLISGSAKLAKSVGISLLGLLFTIGFLNLLTSII